jgi:predicted nucleotidyltransferase
MSHATNRLTQALAEVLSDEPQVLAAYHFGSSSDGTAHESSDVDIGVLFRTRGPAENPSRSENREEVRAVPSEGRRRSHSTSRAYDGTDGASFAICSRDGVSGRASRVPLDELIRIEMRLDDSIQQTVDLVDVKRAGPFVALEIISGDRFFCHDETAADEFDLYVLRRAGDLEYFERERRAFFLESPFAPGVG